MRKLLLLVGIIMILCISASAQQTTAGITGKGIKLGIGFAGINTDYDELDEFLDSRVGFTGGAFMTYSLNRQFAVQPEILYVSKGAEKDLFFVSAEWSIDYLELPVLLKYDLVPDGKVNPNLFIGPAFALLLSSELRASSYSVDVTDVMKSMDVGLVFGGGIEYKRITFDVRYTLGLMGTVDAADEWNELTEAEPGDYYYLESDPSVKNTNLSFMIGVKF
nr:PorT family protein [candidate division Zixibacteria bacterium]